MWLSPPDALLPHWPMYPCLCCETLFLLLPPFLLQTLPLLPLSQLLLLPRLLRLMFLRLMFLRLIVFAANVIAAARLMATDTLQVGGQNRHPTSHRGKAPMAHGY